MEKAEKDANLMVESYLKDPNPENLHGLRRVSRRMLTINQLLPGDARRGKHETYMEKFANLLEITRKARHVDILLSKLPSDNTNKTTEAFAKRLRKIREASLGPARRAASVLKHTSIPEIDPKDFSDSNLQKRFDKATQRLTSRIQESLPDVIKDRMKRKQLQQLRQESRKLRYMLELSGGPETSERLSALRSWQELLATIHDDDVSIQQLEGNKKTPEIQTLMDQVSSERSENYLKFRSLVEERPVFKAKN